MSDALFAPVRGEPWVRLRTGQDFATWTKDDEVAHNQMIRQSEKLRFFALTMDYVKENGVEGDYFEFGCHRARTFRMALTEARCRSLDDMRFLAFDSFEGLPAGIDDHGVANWQAGMLATSDDQFRALIAEHGVYVDRVRTVKGFYDQSLTPELAAELKAAGRKAAVVTVDCDYYESSVPVFNFIEDFLVEGSVIYIDDYFAGYRGSPNRGVARAFAEFRDRSRFSFIEHLQVGWSGRSFIAYL